MQNKGKVKLERKHYRSFMEEKIIIWFLLRVQTKILPRKKHTSFTVQEIQCPVSKVKHQLEGTVPISHHG